MSDNYRDGCSKKAGVVAWLAVTLIQLGAWIAEKTERKGR